MTMAAEQLIADWRTVTKQDTYSSSSRVQDRLFDLYAEVRDQPVGRLIETWLSLTIQRDLFSSGEILELLDQIQAQLASPVSTGS
ncbi:MAG: hypothetical protein H0U41_02220 [Actinobacteria bacterium]|nr:hypothetical protein [Actinomycetota bacterium]